MFEKIAHADTGAVSLPAIPQVQTDNLALNNFIQVVKERLEVREGSRGNQWEKTVTQRDVRELNNMLATLKSSKETGQSGAMLIELGGGLTASLAIAQFEKSIKDLAVYKALQKRLDDPTRFDHLAGEFKKVVVEQIADEAKRLGTTITQTEQILNESNRQLALKVSRVYASLGDVQAGVRQTYGAVVEANFAQATLTTQVQASLGNYYKDGTPGRATLESEMTGTADRIRGLSAQWTFKVQAGKAIAGIGLAATEDGAGNATSAVIISAEKFAIVNPMTYTAGLTNTPDTAHIPFGVDANGIYLNHNVYIRGNIRVDTGGKTLVDGLRGSLNIGISGGWSDTAARNAIFQQLGKGSSAPNNNHLVIGDSVTMSVGTTAVTRFWNGSSWSNPGMVLNGDLLVNGSVSAQKINTNGLEIRDASGTVIFSSGVDLDVSRVMGLGAMATAGDARIGENVKFPDGTTLRSSDFVNRLSRINSLTIGTFMESAAIGSLYIGHAAIQNAHIQSAAVRTLSISGGSVTSMNVGYGSSQNVSGGAHYSGASVRVDMDALATGVVITGVITVKSQTTNTTGRLSIYRASPWGPLPGGIDIAIVDDKQYTHSIVAFDASPVAGRNDYVLVLSPASGGPGAAVQASVVTACGGKR